MSESKVPLLPLPAAYWIGNNTELAIHSLREWARSYGDARAAEARRLALLEAAEFVANLYSDEGEEDDDISRGEMAAIADAAGRLRDLADEASPKSVSG